MFANQGDSWPYSGVHFQAAPTEIGGVRWPHGYEQSRCFCTSPMRCHLLLVGCWRKGNK